VDETDRKERRLGAVRRRHAPQGLASNEAGIGPAPCDERQVDNSVICKVECRALLPRVKPPVRLAATRE
jgi:hypothetical protein